MFGDVAIFSIFSNGTNICYLARGDIFVPIFTLSLKQSRKMGHWLRKKFVALRHSSLESYIYREGSRCFTSMDLL